MRPILLLIAAACLASAQGELSGPSLGFFVDPHAQALRRILGIPGSATASESLDVGFPVVNAAVSPAQDYALVTDGDGSVNLITLAETGIAWQKLAVLPMGPDRIVLSASGNSAALAYGASIKILSGLPGSTDRLDEVDASSLPGLPGALAVSDDGALLLASVPDNAETSSAGGVFVFAKGSGPRLIVPHAISDVSFFPSSHDAVFADEDGNSVTLVADAGGDATTKWTFVDDRLAAPTTAKPTLDGQRVLLASAANGAIVTLDRNGGDAVFMTCACKPDRAAPLSNLVYQMTDPGKGLLWILDLSQDSKLFFVPIPPAPGGSQ